MKTMRKVIKGIMGAMVEHPTDEMVDEFLKTAPYATMMVLVLACMTLVSALFS